MSPAEQKTWRDRAAALRNIPPVLKLLWQSGPGEVTGEMISRVLAALVPIATLGVAKTIIDIVVGKITHPAEPLPS